MKTTTKRILIGLGIFTFLWFGLCIFLAETTDITEKLNAESTSNSVGVGEQGKLYQEGYTIIHVCKTKDYFNELIGASVANDRMGYQNLIMSPKCYGVSIIEPYGEVLVLDKTWNGLIQVRFTNPNAIHYGESAWTNMESVIK